jgi:preprotein translocase subunit SecD
VAYHLEVHWTESAPPARREDLSVPPGAHVVSCGPPASTCPGLHEIPRRTVYYALTGQPELTTSDFAVGSAQATFSQNGPVVHVRLTERGRARFRTLTRHIARVGRRERRHNQLALVVGDRIVAVPTIDYEQSPSGIDSRVVEIAGLSSATEAEKIAEGLRGG